MILQVLFNHNRNPLQKNILFFFVKKYSLFCILRSRKCINLIIQLYKKILKNVLLKIYSCEHISGIYYKQGYPRECRDDCKELISSSFLYLQFSLQCYAYISGPALPVGLIKKLHLETKSNIQPMFPIGSLKECQSICWNCLASYS